MSYEYEILAQEIWLVERTYKCLILGAINSQECSVTIEELEDEFTILIRKYKNSYQNYASGYEIIWGEFPQSGIFKIREVQLVSTSTYTVNDSPEDALYLYEETNFDSTEYEVLEDRFIDSENYYAQGYNVYEVRLS
jgi:hypothetical protein